MSKKPDPAKVQAHIDEIQRLYSEWNALFPQLQSARKDWKRSMKIMKKLEAFYFGKKFLRYHEAIEEGLKINPVADDENSVMGEDTLWNAFNDQHELAQEWMRDAMDVLHPKKDND